MEAVEQIFEANGLRLNVAVWQSERPSAPPILLLHGIWDTWKIFAELGPLLAEHRPVYAVDLRGHGKSDKPESGYGYPEYAADIRALVEQLPGDGVDLFAYSMGVPVAAFVAMKNARVRKLVLEDPPLHPRSASRAAAAKWLGVKRLPFAEVVTTMRSTYPTRSAALVEENARTLVMTADGALEAIANGQQDVDWPPNLVDVDAPTLVLQADVGAGGLLSDENRVRLMSFLKRGELVQFPGSGHSIHGERCRDLFRAVDAFLGRNGP